MSKKLIAAMLALTTVFVCVFAACNKDKDDDERDTRPYIENDEYEFVTDENGEKVLNEDGEFVVYATEENGKIVTDENGENVTRNQLFQAFQNDDTFEDYGYKIKLPEGWEPTTQQGCFENAEKNQKVDISIVNKSYSDYLIDNYNVYSSLNEMIENKDEDVKDIKSVKWEEDIDFSEEAEGAVRFTLVTAEGTTVMYFFENSNNLYKILFHSPDSATAVEDSLLICKSMSYKPYQYYIQDGDLDTTKAE